MKTYHKIAPVQAIQLTDNTDEILNELKAFGHEITFGSCGSITLSAWGANFNITLQRGDYIILQKGDVPYVVNKEVFERTYELVD